MFRKFFDVLREVFWLKKSPQQKRLSSRKTKAKTAPKKAVKAPPKPKQVKKTAPKKTIVKTVKPKIALDPALVQVGEITHYFERIKVCVVKITKGSVLIGDRLTIAARGGAFAQKVWSMQIESRDVKVARKGQLIGLKVDKPVAAGDKVCK